MSPRAKTSDIEVRPFGIDEDHVADRHPVRPVRHRDVERFAHARLGPDEYYARLPVDTSLADGAGQSVSVVDVSARAFSIVLEGAHAVEVLCAGCPLDLAGWPVGRTSRTIFEAVEIIVTREAEARWHVEIWRGFAPWLWAVLSAAAAD